MALHMKLSLVAAAIFALTACAVSGAGPNVPATHAMRSFAKLNLVEYKLPKGRHHPAWIAQGPKGKLWFTLDNAIGSISTRGYIHIDPLLAHVQPFGITEGSDGNIWFTAFYRNRTDIGKLVGMKSTLYPVHTTCCLENIVNGPDGNLWFVGITYYRQTDELDYVFQATTHGSVKFFFLPYQGSSSYTYVQPTNIAAGPDGALWFTEFGTNSIGRMTTGGTLTNQYAVPSGQAPLDITAGPDGALWFTEQSGVGRISVTGAVTEYGGTSGTPLIITPGPDGALWFTENNRTIGHITTTGILTEYTTFNQANFITLGPDGAVWFTENKAGKIGRATPPT